MTQTVVTWAQFEKHIYSYDCWVLVDGSVYNVSDFLVQHPGGDDILVKFSGRDATAKFIGVPHSDYAVSLRNARLIGKIQSAEPPAGYLERIENIKKVNKQAQKRKLVKRTDPITQAELALHKSAEKCWIVIKGKVYDTTDYLEEHPGGVNKIMEWAGSDATKAFNEVRHSVQALEKAEQYCVGTLENKFNPLFILVLVVVVIGAVLLLLK